MARVLRIGVNALYLIPGGVGGTEIYLRNLLEALAEIDRQSQYFVFINAESSGAHPPLTPQAPNFQTVRCPVRAIRRPERLLWEQVALPLQAAFRRIDVLFSPGFTSPVLTVGAKVTVIHDLQHKRQPQNFGRLELAAWRALVWTSARFSRLVVAVSESSRQDILEVYRLPPERVRVVRHGVERALFGLEKDATISRSLIEPVGIGKHPYLLAVSTVHPHKNWGRWLEAYQQLVRQGFPHHLVIAGLQGTYFRQLMQLIEATGLGDRVHVTGWVPRNVLLALFKFTDALVYPSTFEGFGMPVLEAMAAGVPVACSDIGPLREAAGGAALFFDPYSVDSILAVVHRLLGDAPLRRQMVELGRENAAARTWTRAGEQTLAVLREAAGVAAT